MINPFSEVNWQPSLEDKRKFSKSLMIGFPLIALLFATIGWLKNETWNPFFVYLGLGGFSAGLIFWLFPQISKPFYLMWYFLACSIGVVIANLLFCAFYYLLLTSIGIIVRKSGKLSFRKGFDKSNSSSYWKESTNPKDTKSYFQQF